MRFFNFIFVGFFIPTRFVFSKATTCLVRSSIMASLFGGTGGGSAAAVPSSIQFNAGTCRMEGSMVHPNPEKGQVTIRQVGPRPPKFRSRALLTVTQPRKHTHAVKILRGLTAVSSWPRAAPTEHAYRCGLTLLGTAGCRRSSPSRPHPLGITITP